MQTRLHVDILPQPDDTTCGPTCLHAIYRYFDDPLPLDDVIAATRSIAGGGTLAVMLGIHALSRGYRVRIHTYNVHVFDPTWFTRPGIDLADRLRRQRGVKDDPKLHAATGAYLEFLAKGGQLLWEDLTGSLLRRYLRRGIPILAGLSSTYLYQEPRQVPPNDDSDDVAGVPQGHFVVLSGYDQTTRTIHVADPYAGNPVSDRHHYMVPTERVVSSILLGVLTYDANFMVLEPRRRPREPHR
ncbi:MAG: C39 family peptidase [Planctomycetes bacterium]|nr:C39 family peptidase [Planctomycetota bacterium]